MKISEISENKEEFPRSQDPDIIKLLLNELTGLTWQYLHSHDESSAPVASFTGSQEEVAKSYATLKSCLSTLISDKTLDSILYLSKDEKTLYFKNPNMNMLESFCIEQAFNTIYQAAKKKDHKTISALLKHVSVDIISTACTASLNMSFNYARPIAKRKRLVKYPLDLKFNVLRKKQSIIVV